MSGITYLTKEALEKLKTELQKMKSIDRPAASRAIAEAREKGQGLRKAAKAAETELARLNEAKSAVDRAMFDPDSAAPEFARLTMTDLMKRRAELEGQIEAAEVTWMEASEALEALAA